MVKHERGYDFSSEFLVDETHGKFGVEEVSLCD
jgi:hypothetical protein